MPKQVIKGASVAPVYSPATHGPGFVYVSGQIGLDPASGTLDLAESVVEQAEQAFRNTISLLESAGSSPGLICKMNVFVNDRAHLGAVQAVFHQYIGRFAPARSDIVVRKLPLNAKIEVESFAVKAGVPRYQVDVDAVGGVARAVIGGSKVFLSSVSSPSASADVTSQTESSLTHLDAALAASGITLSGVSKIDAYVAVGSNADDVTVAIAKHVAKSGIASTNAPAVSVVYSASLPADTLVELACVGQTSPHSQAVQLDGADGGSSTSSSDAVVLADGTIFVGAQMAAASHESIASETEELLERVSAVVSASGHTLDDVSKVNIYMDSMDDYGEINKVYARYFTANGMAPPARAAVEVHRLPEGRRIAIECVVLGTFGRVAGAKASSAVEHVVLLAFRKDMTAEESAELTRRMLAFRSVTFGPSTTPDRSGDYTHALVVRFANEADAQEYQTHPEHVRGINEAIRPNLNSSVAKPVLALDFLIDAGAQVRGNDIAAAL